MDHPYFFVFFCSGHAGDDFQLRGELFFPYRFAGTVFVPHNVFFVSRLTGMDRCNKLVL